MSLGSSSVVVVPLVHELVKENITEIPNRYIRTTSCLDHEYHHSDGASKYDIPVIDVDGGLLSGESVLADSELHKLHSVCQHWGFFQVVNHGISSILIDQLKSEIHNLFQLPLEEKTKIWREAGEMEGFGQKFVVSDEQKLDWSDTFSITAQPIKMRKPQIFAGMPLLLREALEAYSLGLKNLTMILLGKMAEALKMDSDEIEELFNDCTQRMRMNYYPPCPKAKQVIGLSPHSDAAALSIVLQLNQTEGLEIRKDGKWVPVKPIPGALIVNLGDMIEILSNGAYPSIEHRVMVNPTKERLSIATFHSTNPGSEFGPAPCLIDPPHKPALFRRETEKKYYENFFAKTLNGKTTNLDFMRINTENGNRSS
ncbi:protein SRG1-like [Papaver somniferum]|uniref:protein SRG1-like n=1 Tax=Papaver somniferum TaxID=3469 RepID=UPI000E6FB50E|nr:protein SRG1-like [Papaver somniferum]